MVRGLVVPELGAPPAVRESTDPALPPGHALVRMSAAALNPADLAIGAGRFYMPLPPAPFVAGCEAVGRVERSARLAPGTRVWCLQGTGCFAEAFTAPEDALVPVPDGVSDPVAAAFGIAGLAGWMSLLDRGGLRAGERVLVLGASGVVGQVAIQAARAGGAERVVGVSRSAAGADRARRLGADATVLLDGGLDAPALRRALGGGADLVLDTLWGAPLLAALGALARGARVVQVGSAAAPTAEVAAGPLRGGRTDIRGFSVFSEDRADLADAYPRLVEAARDGAVRLEIEPVPLADGPRAWARQAAGAGGLKLVLVP